MLDSGLERLRPLSRLTELSLNDSGLRELPRDLTALQELEVGGSVGVFLVKPMAVAAQEPSVGSPTQVLNLSYTSPRRGWKYLMRLPRLHKLLTGREPPWEVYQAVKVCVRLLHTNMPLPLPPPLPPHSCPFQVVRLDVYDEESDSEADYLSSDSDAP